MNLALPVLVPILCIGACSVVEAPLPCGTADAQLESPAAPIRETATEAGLIFSYHGLRDSEVQGGVDLVFSLRNERAESVGYFTTDESRPGPSYLIEIREGETTREESPWWCGQGAEFVELLPRETVELLVPGRWMDGDGLRAVVHLSGSEGPWDTPLVTVRSPEVPAW